MDSLKARRKKPWLPWLVAGALCLTGFGAGWFIKEKIDQSATPQPLRLSGYQFIDPLLSCNFSSLRTFPEDQSMHSLLQSVIDKHVAAGDIIKGSVYFGDFTIGSWAEAYNNEQYYPSSLGKIPIMMAYYELAETSSTVLDQKITYLSGGSDLNDTQDIPPLHAIVPGQTYSVEELIEYMLKYSDNNAAQLLVNNIDQNALTNVYNDLQIPINKDVTLANADFITPQQIATLFRVLYNGTYLTHQYSEKALKIMSESSFTQGLVAELPSSTPASHKLGLVDITSGGVPTEHELHDCGIIYAPSHPYLLCVMTRGSSDLGTMEQTIADISNAVYQKITGLR